MENINYKGVSVRLYPNEWQKERLERMFKARHWIWNYFVNINNAIYLENEKLKPNGSRTNTLNILYDRKFKPILRKYGMQKELTKMRYVADELKDVPVSVLDGTSLDIERAYKRYFNRLSKMPKAERENNTVKFRYAISMLHICNSKHKVYISGLCKMQFPNFKRLYKDKDEGIRYRGYIDKTRIKKITNFVIRKDHFGDYYLSINYILHKCDIVHDKRELIVGLDLGIRKYVTDSNGLAWLPLPYQNYFKEDSRLMARRRNLIDKNIDINSTNIPYRIKCLRRKNYNQWTEYLYKIANFYTKHYDYIVLEKLKILDLLTKRYKKDAKKGIHVNKSRRTNRIVNNLRWYRFRTILESVAKRNNSQLIYVNPDFTSQMCSNCHSIHKLHRVNSMYKCTFCGHEENADVNAAKNILAYGKITLDNIKNMISSRTSPDVKEKLPSMS